MGNMCTSGDISKRTYRKFWNNVIISIQKFKSPFGQMHENILWWIFVRTLGGILEENMWRIFHDNTRRHTNKLIEKKNSLNSPMNCWGALEKTFWKKNIKNSWKNSQKYFWGISTILERFSKTSSRNCRKKCMNSKVKYS